MAWGIVGSITYSFRGPTAGLLNRNGKAPAIVEVGTNAGLTWVNS